MRALNTHPWPASRFRPRMLHRIVEYLRARDVPFRLFSYPSPEPLPVVLHRPPPGGMLVETRVLVVAGQPAIACIPRGSQLDLPRLVEELHAEVFEGSAEDLPPPWKGVAGPLPVLGRALEARTFFDERVSTASPIAFAAFRASDVFEIPIDELVRVEQPRVSAFAIGGELPQKRAA